MDTQRLCQYDRRALYDGYANIYTFVMDEIKIKLVCLPINEGKEEFKTLGLFVAKESFKDKTKLHMHRLVPKPPWEDVIVDFSLGLLRTQQQKDSIND